MKRQKELTRRGLLAAIAGAAGLASASSGLRAAAARRGIPLGFDNFSVRALGWKAPELLDYAASLDVDVILFSDLDVFESHEPEYLKRIREQADGLGLAIHAGTGGICPTAGRFRDKWGTAEEHLALTIRVARDLGSPVARCFLGNAADRKGDGGIERHIESTIEVCRAVRGQAVDAGVTIAIENHAGDLQAWELAALIEEAGSDYVGATIDSGNATWTLEDPMVNLEILAKYAVSSGMRDSAVWRSEDGAFVEWANIGDGHVDWSAYLDRWQELCPPGTPFILETISMVGPREYPYFREEFWEPYPRARAHEFGRFAAMAERGEEFVAPAGRPVGEKSNELSAAQQKFDLEASLRYCRDELNLGL